MSATLLFFNAIFIGGVSCRAFGWLGKVHAERLAALVFSVSLPATILVSLDRMTWSAHAWRLPLAACLVTGLMLLSSWTIPSCCGCLVPHKVDFSWERAVLTPSISPTLSR